MKKGDFVKVKKGVKEPEYQKSDMSGWTGVIVDIYEPENGDEKTVEIQWDIDTIKKLPIEFIKTCISDGCFFSEMNLGETDVVVVEGKGIKDNPKERENLIVEIENKYESAGFDGQEKKVTDILMSANVDVNQHNLAKYRKHLIANLKEPVYLTGIEDFSWEERFVFGFGSEEKYAQLRKTRPSYRDTFKLMKILGTDEYHGDLLARVKRKTDRKVFEIPLSRLESIDKDSVNYSLLDDFSVWVVNY